MQKRLVELDVLRGFAVAVMILVTSPGDWAYTYAQMQHADWNGWRFADLVFPDFLFGVGMALGLTFVGATAQAGDRRAFWLKVARRVVSLIALGLALNYLYILAIDLGKLPIRADNPESLRIPGVLQRIAICYLLAVGILFATTARRPGEPPRINGIAIGGVIAAILLTYWALMTFVPVPGFAAGQLDQTGNLAASIDRAIFTPQHMWAIGSVEWAGPIVYDPEGLLSSLPATANVLFGVIAIGIWQSAHRHRIELLLAMGIALIGAGLLLDPLFPINKKIWTSSFALLSSGFSFLALLIAVALLRAGPARLLAEPLRILGGNAILAFALSIVITVGWSIPITGGDSPQTLQQLSMAFANAAISNPYLASLACASTVLLLVFMIVWPLHRRGIFLRL